MKKKFMLLVIAVFALASVQAQTTIVTGPVTNAANGHVYYLLSASTWTAAEAKAVTLGGHLATIGDAAEDHWVYTNFGSYGGVSSHLWIGLTDVAQEGTFVWTSGEALTYTNWYPGNPSGGTNENYVHINAPVYGSGSRWNDIANVAADSSGVSFRGVVEITPAAPPSLPILAGPVTNAANGHVYYLLSASTWTAAEAKAVTLGGHLATIGDAAEDHWVYTNFGSYGGVSSHLWIGLTDAAQEGNFVWTSGEALTYMNWYPGNPSGGTNENYVHINAPVYGSGSRWNDIANVSADSSGVPFRGVVEIAPVAPPTLPYIVAQPVSQTVGVGQPATFRVSAGGTPPLSYQWRKNGTNLINGGNVSGATTTNLHLAAVTLADAGNYDVVVSNLYATTNSSGAVLSLSQTRLTIGSTNAVSGSTLTVPIVMNALGVENTFVASVNYDTSKLVLQAVQLGQATAAAYLQEVDTQTNIGNVGFAILLDYGAVIPAGTQQVARLVFKTLPVTNTVNTSLIFGDSPTTRQLVDNDLNSLPVTYLGGTIVLAPAEYAADVFPRPNGDHQVVLQDWLEVGRMVAKLDIITNSDELLRADCAPRSAPDGFLTVADWVQAGRYALGLDPLTLVTPPAGSHFNIVPHGGAVTTRTLQLGTVSATRGQVVSVPVMLIGETNENAIGLTLVYNTNQLKFITASVGSALAGGRLNVNTNMALDRVGLALAMAPGNALTAGTNQVAVLQFLTNPTASGTASLTLDSSVIQLQVADKTAVALAANYVDGSVVLPPVPTLQMFKIGDNLQLAWPVATGSFSVQSASSPVGPWSDANLAITINGVSAIVTVQATNQQQFFRLVGQ